MEQLTTVDKKRRSDSWDAALTDEQQLQAFAWAQQLGYAAARQMIAEEFGIEAPSMGAMTPWYRHMSRHVGAVRLEKALVDAESIETMAAALPHVNAAVAAGLGQRALDAIVTGDPSKIKVFATLALNAQREARSDQEVQLARERFEFDAAEAALAALDDLRDIAADNDLDSRAKIDQVRRRLFGEVPE